MMVGGHAKFEMNAHNFSHSGSNSIKMTFLNSSHQNLLNNRYFVWFHRGTHFLIVLGNVIIICHMVQICISSGTLNRLSASKVSMLKVVFGKFYR